MIRAHRIAKSFFGKKQWPSLSPVVILGFGSHWGQCPKGSFDQRRGRVGFSTLNESTIPENDLKPKNEMEDFLVEEQNEETSEGEEDQRIRIKEEKERKHEPVRKDKMLVRFMNSSDSSEPYFDCQYGKIRPLMNCISAEKLGKLKEIVYVDSTTSVNFITSIFKKNRNTLIIFPPSNSYYSVQTAYKALRRKLWTHFFGTPEKPLDPFSKCKTPSDRFNLYRRIQNEIASFLSQVGFLIDYSGQPRLKNAPAPRNLKKHVDFDEELPAGRRFFYKTDYFLNVSSFNGANSAYQYEKEGVVVPLLQGKRVYFGYGVWPPTNVHIYRLFAMFLEERRLLYADKKTAVDFGCGSGILSFIVKTRLNVQRLWALDSFSEAVRFTKINSQILNFQDSISSFQADICEESPNDVLKKLRDLHGVPSRVDLVVCNPPWIIAKPMKDETSIENGNYDEKEQFLQRFFEVSSQMIQKSKGASGKNGTILLLYSDYSQKLGLQKPDRIEELCLLHSLRIIHKAKLPFALKEDSHKMVDPLKQFKKESSYILYEITKA